VLGTAAKRRAGAPPRRDDRVLPGPRNGVVRRWSCVEAMDRRHGAGWRPETSTATSLFRRADRDSLLVPRATSTRCATRCAPSSMTRTAQPALAEAPSGRRVPRPTSPIIPCLSVRAAIRRPPARRRLTPRLVRSGCAPYRVPLLGVLRSGSTHDRRHRHRRLLVPVRACSVWLGFNGLVKRRTSSQRLSRDRRPAQSDGHYSSPTW